MTKSGTCRRGLRLVLALVASAVMAACGGGGDADPASAPPATPGTPSTPTAGGLSKPEASFLPGEAVTLETPGFAQGDVLVVLAGQAVDVVQRGDQAVFVVPALAAGTYPLTVTVKGQQRHQTLTVTASPSTGAGVREALTSQANAAVLWLADAAAGSGDTRWAEGARSELDRALPTLASASSDQLDRLAALVAANPIPDTASPGTCVAATEAADGVFGAAQRTADLTAWLAQARLSGAKAPLDTLAFHLALARALAAADAAQRFTAVAIDRCTAATTAAARLQKQSVAADTAPVDIPIEQRHTFEFVHDEAQEIRFVTHVDLRGLSLRLAQSARLLGAIFQAANAKVSAAWPEYSPSAAADRLADWPTTEVLGFDASQVTVEASSAAVTLAQTTEGALVVKLVYDDLEAALNREKACFPLYVRGSHPHLGLMGQVEHRACLSVPKPVAQDIELSVRYGEAVDGTLKGELWATFEWASQPTSGTVSAPSGAAIRFSAPPEPADGASRTVEFSYVAVNSAGRSAPARVRVTIGSDCQPVRDAMPGNHTLRFLEAGTLATYQDDELVLFADGTWQQSSYYIYPSGAGGPVDHTGTWRYDCAKKEVVTRHDFWTNIEYRFKVEDPTNLAVLKGYSVGASYNGDTLRLIRK